MVLSPSRDTFHIKCVAFVAQFFRHLIADLLVPYSRQWPCLFAFLLGLSLLLLSLLVECRVILGFYCILRYLLVVWPFVERFIELLRYFKFPILMGYDIVLFLSLKAYIKLLLMQKLAFAAFRLLPLFAACLTLFMLYRSATSLKSLVTCKTHYAENNNG